METTEKVQATHHTQQLTTERLSQRLTFDRHVDSLGYRETATIIPLGRFTYHPDSGYRGHAAHVQLQRQGVRTQRHILRDSTRQLHRIAATVSDSAATGETRTVDQREQRGTPWRWAGAALLLLLLVGFLARRLFH